MKKSKSNKEAHTSNTKKSSGDWHVSHSSMGMGDYYGTGIKAKLGRVREGVGMQKATPKQLKTPPRSVV
jgi:NaMN:DMB phosphoribosyltransferase